MMENDRGLGTVTRRSALQGIGTGAISLAAIGGVSADDTDDTKQITVVEGSGEARLQKEVPADWWDWEMKTERVQKKLRDRYGINSSRPKAPGIDGVGIISLDESIGGYLKSSIGVFVNEKGTDQEIPSTVDGVPVEVIKTPEPEPNACYWDDYDPMPGGVSVADTTGSAHASACCEVEYGGTNYILTTYHMYTCDNDSVIGEPLYQYTQKVGNVSVLNQEEDWVLVPRGNNTEVDDFENKIIDESGILAGYVTKDGLRELKSNETTVYNNGKSSCRTSGVVEKIDHPASTCHMGDARHYVTLSTPTQDGDSGSPHYHKYTYNGCDYIGIIAPHYGGDSVGCGAFKINSHGIEFDPEYEYGYCK